MRLNKMDPVTDELIERHVEAAYEHAYSLIRWAVDGGRWHHDDDSLEVAVTKTPEHYPVDSDQRSMITTPITTTLSYMEEKLMGVPAGKYMDPDEIIGSAISKAIRHSERVAKREHIKADRVERVKQFLVSLRRELGYISSAHPLGANLANSLLRKELWYDLGQMHPNFPTYRVSFSKDTLIKWMTIAQRLRKTDDAQTDEIKGDLEELERSLAGMTSLVDESGRIADESEIVAGQLCHVLS